MSASISHPTQPVAQKQRPYRARCLLNHNRIGSELVFQSIVAGLWRFLPPGSVVDAGAHQGGEACFYAELDSSRRVHAIEPLPKNLEIVINRYGNRSNLIPLHGGLGSTAKWLSSNWSSFGYWPGSDARAQLRPHYIMGQLCNTHLHTRSNSRSDEKGVLPIYALDDLFHAGGTAAAVRGFEGETLAFGHFDVRPRASAHTHSRCAWLRVSGCARSRRLRAPSSTSSAEDVASLRAIDRSSRPRCTCC